MLLGGRTQQYRDLYEKASSAFTNFTFFRPMTPDMPDILISGLARAEGSGAAPTLDPNSQHLVCFTGGMVGIAAKIFNRPEDIKIARKLVDGCIWSYQSQPNGMMAEVAHMVPCEDPSHCSWDEQKWRNSVLAMMDEKEIDSETPIEQQISAKIDRERLPPGYSKIDDNRYILR